MYSSAASPSTCKLKEGLYLCCIVHQADDRVHQALLHLARDRKDCRVVQSGKGRCGAVWRVDTAGSGGGLEMTNAIFCLKQWKHACQDPCQYEWMDMDGFAHPCPGVAALTWMALTRVVDNVWNMPWTYNSLIHLDCRYSKYKMGYFHFWHFKQKHKPGGGWPYYSWRLSDTLYWSLLNWLYFGPLIVLIQWL